MNFNNSYKPGTPEYGMMKRLNELKDKLTNYTSTEQFRRYGFDIIRPWTDLNLKSKKLFKRLLEETDVLPCRGLENYIEDYFSKRNDNFDSAVQFIKENDTEINNIRDAIVRTIHAKTLPNDEYLLERLNEKISVLKDNNKKRTVKKLRLKIRYILISQSSR